MPSRSLRGLAWLVEPASRTGYKVVQLNVENGVLTGGYTDVLTGFVKNQAAIFGRPVGIACAIDGALLVSEDANGTLWRLAPEH